MQGESSRTNGPHDEEAIIDQGAADAPEAAVSGVRPPAEEGGDPLAQAQEEAARLKDAWLRTAADFDNFRKRTRREMEDARRSGREDLLRVLLPVFDNLERALQSAQRTSDVKAMAEGLKMVERQFVD